MTTLRGAGTSEHEQLIVQIVPLDVGLLNEIHLPLPFPFLEAFLPMNGPPHVPETLEMDQLLDAMSLRESVDEPFPVLPDTSYEIVGYTDVKRAVTPARKDVDVILLGHGVAPTGWPALAGHDSVGGRMRESFPKLLHCLSVARCP